MSRRNPSHHRHGRPAFGDIRSGGEARRGPGRSRPQGAGGGLRRLALEAPGQAPARAHAAREDRHVARHLPGIQRGPGLPFARAVREPFGPPPDHAGHVRPGRGEGRREVLGQPLRHRRPLSDRLESGRGGPMAGPGPGRQGAGPEADRHRRVGGLRLRRRPQRVPETAPRPGPRPGLCQAPRRRRTAGRGLARAAPARGDRGLPPHRRDRPRHHRRGVLPAVITPGITTTADVEWWMWEKVRALGQTTWFNPSISIQRPKTSPYKDSPSSTGATSCIAISASIT